MKIFKASSLILVVVLLLGLFSACGSASTDNQSGTTADANKTASVTYLEKSGEARYTRLAQAFPERAQELFAKAEETAKAKYERLKKLVDFYNV